MSKLLPAAHLKLILFIVLLQTGVLFGGETGKIAGKVVDKMTGEPLPGANVILSTVWIGDKEVPFARPTGAATNSQGEYFIINIPPGVYSVRVSYIGYREEKRTHVQVKIDKTTRVDFQIGAEAIESETVYITAYRPNTVETDLTATKQTYNIANVQSIAGINDISDILTLQADVVDDHFRGGRVGESLYLIGGATIVNPLNNRKAFDPIVSGLEEVEVYTSGFSAEYGNAQSGVVNMVTKEGKDEWESRLEVSSATPYYKTFGGSVYSPKNLFFYDALKNAEE